MQYPSFCVLVDRVTPVSLSRRFCRNAAGETPLHLASTQLSLRGLSLLLAGGANIHAVDDRGRTPLHAACASCLGSNKEGVGDCAHECIQLLLSSGALEDARDGKGQTPLHLAAQSGSLTAAQALVNAGATATADAAGNSPLHLAAARGHVDIMQLFVLRRQADSIATISSVSQEGGSSEKPGHYDGLLRGCIASEALARRAGERELIDQARYLGFDTGPTGATEIGSIGDISRRREQEKVKEKQSIVRVPEVVISVVRSARFCRGYHASERWRKTVNCT